jgi:hypothetical protein
MRLAPLFAGLTAVVVLCVAIPYAVASAQVAPDQRLLAALEDGREEKSYSQAIARHERALDIYRDSQIKADLALLQTSAARQRQFAWPAAQAALESSLRTRPMDPVNWARLAYVLNEQEASSGSSSEATRLALVQSIAFGRFMPGFMQWRLILALSLWTELTLQQQEIVADQVGLLWRQKRSNLIRLARIAPLAATLEQVMSHYYPAELDTFLRHRRPLRHNRGTGAP